jgi:hypothetical protein
VGGASKYGNLWEELVSTVTFGRSWQVRYGNLWEELVSNLWEGVEAAAAGRDPSACHGRSASICATQPVAQFKSGIG